VKLLLVLDLDETLIHAADAPLENPPDFTTAGYFVYQRPHLREFLGYCFESFAVAVWTSASARYADANLTRILSEQERERLVFVYTARQCNLRFEAETQTYYPRKPLKKLKRFGWPKERILAIDDSPEKWELSYGNLIRVRPFEGDPDDDELQKLTGYLDMLKDGENVRTIEKRGWR
jgi:TFIIF-interacting CTD phosphatase-like protein